MKIGFTGLLTIVFIVLKLTGVIEWSWWLIVLPSIIGFVLLVLLMILAALVSE